MPTEITPAEGVTQRGAVGSRPATPPRFRSLGPSVSMLVNDALDVAIEEAERRDRGVTVLDAGCGHRSPLRPFRSRITRLVGVDLHKPTEPLDYLDDFIVVDLCMPDALDLDERFDLILSNFTVEHLADPDLAFANMHRWVRPGGTVVITTVNRRHPFVAAYLSLPDGIRRRLQPVLKTSAADAHPLVGRCNDPASISASLGQAGFIDIRILTVANLARAWGHHRVTSALGFAGDWLAKATPDRQSTIVAIARRAIPEAPAV
jgi:SAM-dependent methyltransferase